MDGLPLRQAAVIGLFPSSLLAHVVMATQAAALQSDSLLTPSQGLHPVIQTRGKS